MNENLDLAEILKNCLIGTKLYSPLIGECELRSVNEKGDYPIQVLACNATVYCYFTKQGIYDKGCPGAECLLFPSKDNRDWSTFKVPNKLPKSWEEFCELKPNTSNDYYIDYIWLALCQLIQLRDCYNDGWQPDWTNGNITKYCITYNADRMITVEFYTKHCILAFKTKELRDEFYSNFIDLIKTAKPLL